MIIVLDASTFVSAALKSNGLPERALLRAVDEGNRLILSREVEDEYREVIFRAKFDRFVSLERRRKILDIVVVAAERIEPSEAVRKCRDPKDDKVFGAGRRWKRGRHREQRRSPSFVDAPLARNFNPVTG